MPAIEVMIKPITNKDAVKNLKETLSKSSVDVEAVEKAKKNLKTVYGFNAKEVGVNSNIN